MKRWAGVDLYVAFFILFLVGWGAGVIAPIFVAHWPRLSQGAALVLGILASAALVALTFRRCSHPSLPFWDALVVIVKNNMSGCAYITVVLISPALLVVCLVALVYTLIGLFAGKDFTLKHWSRLFSRVAKLPRVPSSKDVTKEATATETVSATPPPAPAMATAPETGRVKCPWCAEWIMPDARLCRYCGREVPVGSTYSEPPTKPKH